MVGQKRCSASRRRPRAFLSRREVLQSGISTSCITSQSVCFFQQLSVSHSFTSAAFVAFVHVSSFFLFILHICRHGICSHCSESFAVSARALAWSVRWTQSQELRLVGVRARCGSIKQRLRCGQARVPRGGLCLSSHEAGLRSRGQCLMLQSCISWTCFHSFEGKGSS